MKIPFKLVRHGLLALGIALFLEILIFNFHAYMPAFRHEGKVPVSFDSGIILENVAKSGDGLTVGKGGGSVTVSDAGTSVSSIRFSGTPVGRIMNLSVSVTDESHTAQLYKLADYAFCPEVPLSMTVYAVTQGRAGKLQLSFDESCEGLTVTSVTLNDPGFHFSKLRFLAVLLLFLLLFLICDQKAWRIVYCPGDVRQNLLYGAVVLALCLLPVFFLFLFRGNETFAPQTIPYPLPKEVSAYSNIYVQQFDAFQKGQLNLDLPVSEGLKALENPYDASQRAAASVKFYFDHVYYRGKYYSYYGITPLLVIYYPYYFLTHGIPSNSLTVTAGTCLAVLGLCLLLRQLLLFFVRKINYLLLLFGTVCLAFTSYLFGMGMQYNVHQYILPIFTAIFFSSLFMVFAFAGLRREGKRAAACYVFSGICYVLAAASRPIAVLFLLPLLPFFAGVLADKKKPLKDRLTKAAGFAIPVLAGASLIMAYNLVRFGSPLDFGINYQLTISDPSRMHHQIYDILPAVYHFFFQTADFDGSFPFFHIMEKSFLSYDGFKNPTRMLGAFAYPVMWWLFLIFFGRHRRKREERWMIVLVMVLSLFMAVTEFAMSGTSYRYITEFLWLPASVCILAIVEFFEPYTAGEITDVQGRTYVHALYAAVCLSMAVSVMIGAAMMVKAEDGIVRTYLPGVFMTLQRLFTFW